MESCGRIADWNSSFNQVGFKLGDNVVERWLLLKVSWDRSAAIRSLLDVKDVLIFKLPEVETQLKSTGYY